MCKQSLAHYNSYDILSLNGDYTFSYQQTPDNLVPVFPGNTGTAYTWESCVTPLFQSGTVTAIGTAATYTFSSPLAQTTYFRRKTTIPGGTVMISNVVKIEVVSVYWEDINYVREHSVLVSGQTDWKAIDQLPTGQKMQTTTYLDGLGRPLQQVGRETATPALPAGTWGDQVQFYQYDAFGRQPKQYLPYTTTSEPGKYKTNPADEQTGYYADANTYNETAPYYKITFDGSPLNKVVNVKSPGTAWAAGTGNGTDESLNSVNDDVQQFDIGYTPGLLPELIDAYPANTLIKTTHTDENGSQVVNFTNSLGQVVLTKTELNATHAHAYDGWICTYNVYDDFGRLRFQMQPEAVKWLANHSWSFAGTEGAGVADNLCFRYEYDEKGRNILKKAPGAAPLLMVYDARDRMVLTQDGNQAAKPVPEWTATLYDDLDRPILTTLYKTTLTAGQLRTAAATATGESTLTLNNPGGPSSQITLWVNSNFIGQADLNNQNVCTLLKLQFYDDYSFAGVHPFDNNFDNATAYSTGGEVLPVTWSQRTTGFATGSLTRVLGTNTFLASTAYYDAKGNLIQTTEDNIMQGADITTMQYQWDGRLLSTHSKHSTAGTGYSNFGILTKNNFDKIGRITSVEKKYGSNPFKTIASYDLDDMGRLKAKHLSPDAPGGGLESLAYSYNIHSHITGINKDYALKTPGKYNKWDHYFGLYLGYDNRDGVFNTAQLDGHVTGMMWNTQGDDNQRKYDFTYDNAGRLVKSDFREKKTPGDSWNNTKLDFSIGGNNGSIQYDLNGNLLSLQRRGIVIGSASSTLTDDLSYTYASLSNQLLKVTDNATTGTANGALGDFKDGANSGDDYAYDDNGNLITDLNKNAAGVSGGVSTPIGASGITYNYLDKPEFIRIQGKGTIQIVYDANGQKLQRKYTPDGGSTKTTTYIHQFVYEDGPPPSPGGEGSGVRLSFIQFEEGRIRVLTPVTTNNGYDGLAIDGNIDLPDGKRGAFDYFIRDYQQNVRMILSEETHYGINQATMEDARATQEEPYFGQTGSNNEVATTRTSKPAGWAANTSARVSKLSKLSGHTIGPNSLLKVMAGDVFSAKAGYYYPAPVTNNGNPLMSDIVTALINAITGNPAASGVIHGGTGNISSDLNASIAFKTIADPHQAGGGNIPRAYLNVMFFNERFEFVEEGSTALRVSQPGDGAAPLVIPSLKAPKNGYAFIYLSNENDDAVYFDDFIVSYTRGSIIEENHYYAFGLRISGISSRKYDGGSEGSLKNEFLYNDKELWDDADLNWYDYGFRNYDAQIARFTQLDPLTWDYPELTNYQYASNDPIANVDLDGLEAYKVLDEVVVFKALPSAAKVTSAGTSLINIASVSMNIVRSGLIVGDNTRISPINQNIPLSKKINEDNLVWSILGKFSSWLSRISEGSGSYQDYGIIFTGNDNGTMEFKDYATKKTLDAIDIGGLFSLMKSANLDPKVFRDLLQSPGGIKYLENVIKSGSTVRELAETVKDAVKQSKSDIDPMFRKVGNVIYRRDTGNKVKVDSDGSGYYTNEPAKDTFPRHKLEPFYSYPKK